MDVKNGILQSFIIDYIKNNKDENDKNIFKNEEEADIIY